VGVVAAQTPQLVGCGILPAQDPTDGAAGCQWLGEGAVQGSSPWGRGTRARDAVGLPQAVSHRSGSTPSWRAPERRGMAGKDPAQVIRASAAFRLACAAVECRAPGDPWWGSCPRTWAGRSKGLSLKQLHCIWEAPPCRHPGTLSPRRSSTCAAGPSPTPDGPGRPTTEPPAPRPRWPPKGRVPDEDALEWGISHAGHWSTRRLGLLPRLVRTVPTQDAARTHAGRTEDSPRIGARAEEAPRPAP
jgi:hypothetical protein